MNRESQFPGLPQSRNRRLGSVAILSCLLLLGCQNALPGVSKLPKSAGNGTSTVKVNPLDNPNQASIQLTVRGVVRLTTDFGVKLLANNGAGGIPQETGRIISNNSGNLISNNGAGLVTQGTGLISNNGAGALNKAYRLLSQNAAPEDRLAEALIEVVDASGQPLKAADGNPIQAVSNQNGEYTLSATLPKANAVLRVRLLRDVGGEQGELRALLIPNQAQLNVPIDTSSSLASGYVLGEYVKGNNTVLNRMSAEVNTALLRDVNAARKLLKTRPNYDEDNIRSAVTDLRRADESLNQTLETVKALLLLGQENLGSGLPANQVPLGLPVDVAQDAQGNLYIAEAVGRIRKVTPAGVISTYAGERWEVTATQDADAELVGFSGIQHLIAQPDGSLVLSEPQGNRLIRITPDKRVKILAGTGQAGQGELPARATESPLNNPRGVALAEDGTIYLTDENRLLRLDTDGLMHRVDSPPALTSQLFLSVGVASDGALWVLNKAALWRLDPISKAWQVMLDQIYITTDFGGYLRPDDAGGMYVAESGRNKRFWRVGPSGTRQLLLNESLNGTVLGLGNKLIACAAAQALVYEYDLGALNAPPRIVAGSLALNQIGQAQALAVNAPGGLTLSPDRQTLLFTEVAGGTIKALRGAQVDVLHGGEIQARLGGETRLTELQAPAALDYDRQGNLWVLAGDRPRLFRIDPKGAIDVMAGDGLSATAKPFDVVGKPATQVSFGNARSMVVGSDDRPYWTDFTYNVVCRLNPDGQIEVIVGEPGRQSSTLADGGAVSPARDMRLRAPMGLDFDSKGNLYVADTGNMRVLRVAMNDPQRTTRTLIGKALIETLAIVTQTPDFKPSARTPLQDAVVLPFSVHVDAEDRLYIGSAGTILTRLAGSLGIEFPTGLPPIMPTIQRIDLKASEPMVDYLAGPGAVILSDRYGVNALGVPSSMIVDAQSHLVIGDIWNNQIKRVPLPD